MCFVFVPSIAVIIQRCWQFISILLTQYQECLVGKSGWKESGLIKRQVTNRLNVPHSSCVLAHLNTFPHLSETPLTSTASLETKLYNQGAAHNCDDKEVQAGAEAILEQFILPGNINLPPNSSGQKVMHFIHHYTKKKRRSFDGCKLLGCYPTELTVVL